MAVAIVNRATVPVPLQAVSFQSSWISKGEIADRQIAGWPVNTHVVIAPILAPLRYTDKSLLLIPKELSMPDKSLLTHFA